MSGNWLWRGSLLAAAAVTAVLVVQDGVARRASRGAAAFALAQQISPSDAAVQARVAEQSLGQMRKPGMLKRADGAARRALSRDITRVDAVAVSGMVASVRGNTEAARRIMTASDALSRRDLTTRLWFIADAVKRNRTGDALGHFDVALRTSITAHRLLFPLLATAMQDDKLVAPMTRLLRERPAWGAPFLYTAITTGKATRNLARVYEGLNPKPVYEGQDLGALIMETLVAQRDYMAAAQLDRAVHGPRSLIVSPGFADGTHYEPFGWALTATADFDAVMGRDTMGRSGLAVTSTGAKRGVVASQLLSLPAGSYAFAGAVSSDTPQPRSVPRWTLSCAADDRALGEFLPRSAKEARWIVPAGCPFQWLRLDLDAANTLTGEDLFVAPVSLRRVG